MNEKKNIQDLVDNLSESHGLSKRNADSFVKEFFNLIEEALERDKYVRIKGLGTFKLINVDSRESINVNTGERFEIQEHTKISFTPEPALKETINKPFSHFETVVLNEKTVLEDTPEEVVSDAQPSIESTIEPNPIVSTPEPAVPSEFQVHPPIIESETIAEKPADVREPIVREPVFDETMAMPASSLQPRKPFDEEEYRDREPSTMKYFIGIVSMVIILCVAALAFIYFPDLYDLLRPKKSVPMKEPVPVLMPDTMRQQAEPLTAMQPIDTLQEVAPATDSLPQPDSKPIETVKVVPQTTSQVVPQKEPQKESQKESKATAQPIIPDSSSYSIVGTETTYTIKEGETLTRVALRFWGTKKLWPYLVKHNPTIITNPNHVPYGTTIKIPKLEKK